MPLFFASAVMTNLCLNSDRCRFDTLCMHTCMRASASALQRPCWFFTTREQPEEVNHHWRCVLIQTAACCSQQKRIRDGFPSRSALWLHKAYLNAAAASFQHTHDHHALDVAVLVIADAKRTLLFLTARTSVSTQCLCSELSYLPSAGSLTHVSQMSGE